MCVGGGGCLVEQFSEDPVNLGNNFRFDWFVCFADLSRPHEPSLPG